MWGFASNAVSSMGLRKNQSFQSQPCSDCSNDEDDEESCSSESKEEGLECPICCESFNIVENVPYVLWCGHTLCKNCVLGLQWAVIRFQAQQIAVPFFVSCPWCHLLSLRLVYKGNLKFPRKNFFLLWMVESLNGDRVKSCPSMDDGDSTARIASSSSGARALFSSSSRPRGERVEGRYFSLHKSLDLLVHVTSKFPFVIMLLLIVFCVIPGSAIILTIYFLLTVLFAIPSVLVLYFTYPTLKRLVREITA